MIVQKFGGSSVGTPEKIRRVAARIAAARNNGQDVVVVVSAMGDTTDELIELATQVSARPHERELDMLLTAGERISMALLSMALRDCGLEAISFTGSQAGIITDESHTRARIVEIRPVRVREELERGRVVIVAGFQGVSRTKEVTTLGRGGSDTTAVALAAALGASRCEVFTDVPGIYSADPRLVAGARRYERLPLELVTEMAASGAQVMHPRAIEIARSGGFPIYVGSAHPARSNSTPEEEGTMLVPERGLELPKVVAITSKKGLVALTIPSNQAPAVLGELASEKTLVHQAAWTPAGGLVVLVDPAESGGLLARHGAIASVDTYSAVTAVGYQLQNNVLTAARMVEQLGARRIEPAGLTCHPQSITVWFKDNQAGSACDIAVKTLHEELIEKWN